MDIETATDVDSLRMSPSGSGKAINAIGPIYVAPATDGQPAVELHGNSAPALYGLGGLSVYGQVVIQAAETDSDALVLTPNGTGKAINALGQIYVAPTNTGDDAVVLLGNGAGNPLNGETIAEIQDGVATSAAVDAIFSIVTAALDATISSRAPAATALSAVQWTSVRAALLDNLDATITSRLAAADYIGPDNADVLAIKAKTDQLTFTTPGAVNANVTVAIADANELTGVPSPTASMQDKLNFIFMKIRNQETQTEDQATVSNNAGEPIAVSATSDDDSTFTKGRYQ